MVIMGMDPSFRALSVSILNTDTRKVYVNTLSESLGENIGFDKVLVATENLWKGLKSYIDGLVSSGCIKGIEKIFTEVPPPTAAFSAGLYALDNYIIHNLFKEYKPDEVYGIPPSYMSVVHNTNKYNKSESTSLAKYLINEVLPDDIEIIIPDSVSESGRRMKGKLNNDKAESFIFLLRSIVKYNIFDLSKTLSCEVGGLMHESEKLMLSLKGVS